MNLYDAIYKRKAVRKYYAEGLEHSTLESVASQTAEPSRLYQDIGMKIHLVEDGAKIQKISSGFVGSYGKIYAPHYLVATSEEKEGYLENTGYALEKIVLQLTAMGIGTCWIGGMIAKKLLKDIIDISSDQKPVIVVSLGYAKAGVDIVRVFSRGARRKPLSDLVKQEWKQRDGSLVPLSPLIEPWTKIMDAVRVAPSAANLQPWRFVFTDKMIHIYTIKRGFISAGHMEPINRIDAGIAIAHLETAARHFNKAIRFAKTDSALRPDLNYIISAFEE